MGTSGSEGGPGKPTSRKADRAPRSDPYTEHPARDGKVYCCAILDCFSRMIVARTFSTTPDTALVNNAVNMAVANRNRCGSTIVHADHGTPNSHPGASVKTSAAGGCSLPSAPSATAMTTPPWNPSGPAASRATQHPQMGDHPRTCGDHGRLHRQLLQRRTPPQLPR
jgi:Integrase core domain